MDKNIYHCFYPFIFFCLVCLEYIPPILLSCIMCSSLRDDHKRSKRITDSTDATDLFFHGFLCDAFGLCAPLAHGFLRIFPSLEAIQRRQAQRNP